MNHRSCSPPEVVKANGDRLFWIQGGYGISNYITLVETFGPAKSMVCLILV